MNISGVDFARRPDETVYWIACSPSQYAALMTLSPRQEWRGAYRNWRMAGRPGSDSPRMILSWIGQPPIMRGEAHPIEGFRFVQ